MLRLANLFHNLVDKRNDRLVYIMALVDRLDHLVLRDLIGACLDHDHLLCCGSHGQLQITLVPLLLGRIHDELSVHHTHLRRCTRTCKRDIGNCGNQCGTDHGNDLRTACRIYGHYHVVDRHVVAVILRE